MWSRYFQICTAWPSPAPHANSHHGHLTLGVWVLEPAWRSGSSAGVLLGLSMLLCISVQGLPYSSAAYCRCLFAFLVGKEVLVSDGNLASVLVPVTLWSTISFLKIAKSENGNTTKKKELKYLVITCMEVSIVGIMLLGKILAYLGGHLYFWRLFCFVWCVTCVSAKEPDGAHTQLSCSLDWCSVMSRAAAFCPERLFCCICGGLQSLWVGEQECTWLSCAF